MTEGIRRFPTDPVTDTIRPQTARPGPPTGDTTTVAPVGPSRRDSSDVRAVSRHGSEQAISLTATLSPADGHTMAAAGVRHMTERMTAHRQAIAKTGSGLYFGDHSFFKMMNPTEQRDWLKAQATPGTRPVMPKESSCIGWAMENVRAAYEAAGKGDRWAEIAKTVIAKGSTGTALAKELKKDGWEAIYFNPDTRRPADGESEHPHSAALVAKGKPYYGIAVDHQVVNYRPTVSSEGKALTTKDLKGLQALSQAPFFFGMSKGGMHTFVGRSGTVNEFHWDRMPDDPHSISETRLEDFGWLSGLLMVPPGTWPAAKTPAQP